LQRSSRIIESGNHCAGFGKVGWYVTVPGVESPAEWWAFGSNLGMTLLRGGGMMAGVEVSILVSGVCCFCGVVD
jgi:hypothetical protein